jgi:hypothetical protein
LFARGHLQEALSEIGKVRRDDPRRVDADRLQAEVQRALLDAADRPAPVPDAAAAAGRP